MGRETGKNGKRRYSMAGRLGAVYAIGMGLLLLTGLFVFCGQAMVSLDYTYEVAGINLTSMISEIDDRIEGISDILYDIITSGQVQSAGSEILEQERNGLYSSANRQNALTEITDEIQSLCRSENAVLCALYVDEQGDVRTVAVHGYEVLPDEMIDELVREAESAHGETVLQDGREATGTDGILLMAREIRERQNLTLEHIGTVILVVDLQTLESDLLESYDAICVAWNESGECYVLNDPEGILSDEEELAHLQQVSEKELEYSVEVNSAGKWFTVYLSGNGMNFSYAILSPYDELFSQVIFSAAAYLILFLVIGAAMLIIGGALMRGITGDIRRFTADIQSIDLEENPTLPELKDENIRERDVYALQTAYNTLTQRINSLVKDNYEKALLIRDTKLRQLQSQMNPHFLYNTLNSIYWMTKTAGLEEAAEMVSDLAKLFRETANDSEMVVTVDRELELLSWYLSIQKKRYEDRVDFRMEIMPECSDCIMPKLTLQPLVENAILHGLEAMLETCRIEIRIYTSDERMICQVRNSGPPPPERLMEQLRQKKIQPGGQGIGLLNIDQRVKYIFGEEYGVDVFQEEEMTVAQAVMRPMTLEDYQREDEDRSGI